VNNEKIMLHVRVDAGHAARLDELKKQLHLGSRASAIELGMPALLDFLTRIAKTYETTMTKKEGRPS
jgi:hypothetical protein